MYMLLEMKGKILGGEVSQEAVYSVISWTVLVEMHERRKSYDCPLGQVPLKLQSSAVCKRSDTRCDLG